MRGHLRNFLFLALTALVPQLAQAINLPTFPVTANQDPFSATQSLLVIKLTGVGTGYDVADGVPYLGWCAEREDTSYVFGNTSVTLYNSIDPATPSQGNLALPGGMANPNWPKVNYVLNHKQGTANDVQYVIWFYVNGGVVNGLPATAATASMIAAANASGGSFIPGPGQVTAVILYQDGRGGSAQDTLIEVALPQTANGALGDYVWMDTDKDGIQDNNEFGINGVKVNLYDSTNTLIKSTVTANSPTTGLPGWYYFDKLPFGGYKVSIDATTLPANVQATASLQGANRAVDSNGSPTTTSLTTAAPIDLTLDFGYYPKVSWCTYTYSWWKTNTSKWPITSLTLGGVTYTQAELLAILGTPSNSYDDSIELAKQLIGAKLNYAAGIYESNIKSYITSADNYLAAYAPKKVPLKVNNNNFNCIAYDLKNYNDDNCGCVKRW